MRKNNSNVTIGIVGVIIVIFTLSAFFLLDIEKIALYWWALTFLLLAEFVLCGGLILTKSFGTNHGKVFARAGITGVLSIYFIVTLISILSVGLFKDKLHTFILLELGILALFAIIILAILAFAPRIADSDRKIVSDRRFIEDCEKRVYHLLADTKNKEYKSNLNTIYENLKYSDKIGASCVDEKIVEQITGLENVLHNNEESKDDVMHIFDEISALIKQRKMEMSELKRGGF